MENAIDLVIPMVFPDDPQWQQLYNRHHGGAAAAVRNVRFRSWATEELLIRCCLKYMPWLHRIHILLAFPSQVQPWMLAMKADEPRLHLVYHSDFIPEERLPCFASPCIEMFLDRIPGLEEQFIYANDDMFPLSPLAPEDFFRDGRPCHHFKVKDTPGAPTLFQRKCLYQLAMVAAPFGQRFTTTYLKACHSFAPILKSSCREVWRRHGSDILRYLSPLSRTDHSYNHYIYMLYQHFAGLEIDSAPREHLVCKGTPTDALAAVILDPAAGILCINDNDGLRDWERRADIVRRAIQQKLQQ